ncbi:hypothetical protein SAMN02745126_05085 [Enhydrobacter aerosaccus]|uniref:Plastocyanin n=1 Tax=Enhydrobacter aerosaccus TaxID=225324 RepID=A0A1T4SS48_9HYPH|nr:hypothetical protein [Enhydrobacter aerosaccus]SKA31084.1 hypothetical protein SAMN02745126_05085 [Enhydrobacter aerosaccus]
MTPVFSTLVRAASLVLGSTGLLFAFADAALADDSRTFTVVNGTSLPIRQIIVSPHDQSQWGPNLLRVPLLQPGQSHTVTVPPSFTDCNQDIKVAFEGIDAQPVWEYLNICNLRRIKLQYDAMSGVPLASYDE